MLLTVGIITDAQLSEAIRRGYVAAFRWLRSAEDAQDACQEAARKAWSARATFDDRRPLYPWFYRILKNHCMDRLKANTRVPVSAETQDIQTRVPNAEGQILARERTERIEAAIAQLPPDYADVIELRHFQDASYEEMAELIGVPLGTIMSRLYRARRQLRGLLTDPVKEGAHGE